jgi:hypothetical protein
MKFKRIEPGKYESGRFRIEKSVLPNRWEETWQGLDTLTGLEIRGASTLRRVKEWAESQAELYDADTFRLPVEIPDSAACIEWDEVDPRRNGRDVRLVLRGVPGSVRGRYAGASVRINMSRFRHSNPDSVCRDEIMVTAIWASHLATRIKITEVDRDSIATAFIEAAFDEACRKVADLAGRVHALRAKYAGGVMMSLNQIRAEIQRLIDMDSDALDTMALTMRNVQLDLLRELRDAAKKQSQDMVVAYHIPAPKEAA